MRVQCGFPTFPYYKAVQVAQDLPELHRPGGPQLFMHQPAGQNSRDLEHRSIWGDKVMGTGHWEHMPISRFHPTQISESF